LWNRSEVRQIDGFKPAVRSPRHDPDLACQYRFSQDTCLRNFLAPKFWGFIAVLELVRVRRNQIARFVEAKVARGRGQYGVRHRVARKKESISGTAGICPFRSLEQD
jgi:hypothetical protein